MGGFAHKTIMKMGGKVAGSQESGIHVIKVRILYPFSFVEITKEADQLILPSILSMWEYLYHFILGRLVKDFMWGGGCLFQSVPDWVWTFE